MAQVLLRHGADPHVASSGNPDAVAQTRGQPVLLEFLRTGKIPISVPNPPLICPDAKPPCPEVYPLHGIPPRTG